MSNPERGYQPPSREVQRKNEGIVAVRLPKDRPVDFILSSWGDVVTTLQYFQTEEFQSLPISFDQAIAEKKLRREGKDGELSHYSNAQVGIIANFYNLPPTNEQHVRILVGQAKATLQEGKMFTSTGSYHGRSLSESRMEIQQLYRNDASDLYRLKIDSELMGNYLEDKLEEKGLERGIKPKLVVVEYTQKNGKFTVDFDDVSRRLRTVLGDENRRLTGNSLAHRFDENNNQREKIIDLDQYEGLSLEMQCRHSDGFNKKEGNTLVGFAQQPIEGGRIIPTLDISIKSPGIKKKIHGFGYMVHAADYPIIIPEQLPAAQNLAERLAEAFQPNR